MPFRPHSKKTRRQKRRRCSKCGKMLSKYVVRCRACHLVQP